MAEGTGPALLALAIALLLWPPAVRGGLARVRPRHGRRHRAGPPWTSPAGRARRVPVPTESGRATADGPPRPPPTWRPVALAGAAGLAVALTVGGAVGLVGGLATGAGGVWWLRRGRDDTRRRDAVLQDLPWACDLLAVCLAAGVPTGNALGAVAGAVHGPLGDELARVARLHRLGADPRQAWSEVPVELAAVGRAFVRAEQSGSAVGPALRAVAADARVEARSRADERVRRAGVWLLAPLGACFLPAFVCLGVVPVVLGLASAVLR